MSITNVTNATQAAGQQLLGTAVNATGTALAEHAPNAFLAFFTVVIPTFFIRVWDLIAAPVRFPEMQWVIIPLTLTFILLEIYFFQNVDEELGWNTALGNGLVLLFVGIDLTRHLFDSASPLTVLRTLVEMLKAGESLAGVMVPLFILAYGLALVIVNFFHLLPKSVAYKLASHAPVNFIAYVATVAVYSTKAGNPLPLDAYTVLAATTLFTLILYAIFEFQRTPGIRAFQKLRGG